MSLYLDEIEHKKSKASSIVEKVKPFIRVTKNLSSSSHNEINSMEIEVSQYFEEVTEIREWLERELSETQTQNTIHREKAISN